MNRPAYLLAVGAALVLAACGGSDDSTQPPAPTPAIDRIDPFDPGVASPPALAPKAAAAQRTAVAAHTVTLGPLQASAPKAAAPHEGAPLQIGQARSVADTASAAATAALLQWQALGGGSQAAALRFVTDGARGLRLGVLVLALPPGAVLRVQGQDGEAAQITAEALQTLARRNAEGGASGDAARTWWSPDVGGHEATLEIHLPTGAHPADVRLAVPSLSHFTRTPTEATAPRTKTSKALSGTCNIDASCRPEYLEQARSVARYTYVAANGGTFVCTGTLINDAKSSSTPYFLSAYHCISSQAEASTVQSYWFYRSAACNSETLNPALTSLKGGTTLLRADANTDVALMRLNEAPPAGVLYAGSYFGAPLAEDTPLAALHHPGGDRLKFSQALLDGYAHCEGNDLGTCDEAEDTSQANYLGLGWQQGVVEGGSSGSAALVMLDGKRYVVGQLLGGASSCEDPDGADFYGRFDLSMRNGLSQWLLKN